MKLRKIQIKALSRSELFNCSHRLTQVNRKSNQALVNYGGLPLSARKFSTAKLRPASPVARVFSSETSQSQPGERRRGSDGVITIKYRRPDSHAGYKVRFTVGKTAQYSHVLRDPYGLINSTMSRGIAPETPGLSLSSGAT